MHAEIATSIGDNQGLFLKHQVKGQKLVEKCPVTHNKQVIGFFVSSQAQVDIAHMDGTPS